MSRVAAWILAGLLALSLCAVVLAGCGKGTKMDDDAKAQMDATREAIRGSGGEPDKSEGSGERPVGGV